MADRVPKTRLTSEELTADIENAVRKSIAAIKGAMTVNNLNVVNRSRMYLRYASVEEVRQFVKALDDARRKEFGFDEEKPRQRTSTTRVVNPASLRTRWRSHG